MSHMAYISIFLYTVDSFPISRVVLFSLPGFCSVTVVDVFFCSFSFVRFHSVGFQRCRVMRLIEVDGRKICVQLCFTFHYLFDVNRKSVPKCQIRWVRLEMGYVNNMATTSDLHRFHLAHTHTHIHIENLISFDMIWKSLRFMYMKIS